MNQETYYTKFKNKLNNYMNYLVIINKIKYNYSDIKYIIEYEFV